MLSQSYGYIRDTCPKKEFVLGSIWVRSNGLKTVFDDIELKEIVGVPVAA